MKLMIALKRLIEWRNYWVTLMNMSISSKNLQDEVLDMPLHTSKSITDKLIEQLQDINATEQELNAVQILGNLDEHGYLNIEPVLISDRMGIEENQVLSVMGEIRDLDPPGFQKYS